MNRALSFFLLLLIFILHLSFLTADPRLTFCGSRGPFTDEGFYLMQLRSHLAGNGWNLYSADNLLKSPLFSMLHYVPMKLFGSSLAVARCWTLLLAFIPLFIIANDKKWSRFVICFALVVLLQEYIFDYYHYALSESVFCSVTFLCIWLLWRYADTGKKKNLIAAPVLFGLLVWLKVQFIYVLALLVLLLLFISFRQLLNGKFKSVGKGGLYFLIFNFIFLGAYWLFWYHPHKDFYSYILEAVNKNNFIPLANWKKGMEFYYQNIFLIPENQTYTYIFITGFVAAFIGTVTSAFDKIHRYLFAAFSFWFLIELHKLTLNYAPLRYLIPLFFSGLALVAVSISGWIQFLENRVRGIALLRVVKFFSFMVMLLLLAYQLMQYHTRLESRTYVLHEANEYMRRSVKGSGWIAGNWAASVSWALPNPSLPVWYRMLNAEKIFTEIIPEAVITEIDEKDSGRAYKNHGILLTEYADSSRVFSIGRWEVAVYWMKPDVPKLVR